MRLENVHSRQHPLNAIYLVILEETTAPRTFKLPKFLRQGALDRGQSTSSRDVLPHHHRGSGYQSPAAKLKTGGNPIRTAVLFLTIFPSSARPTFPCVRTDPKQDVWEGTVLLGIDLEKGPYNCPSCLALSAYILSSSIIPASRSSSPI